MKQDIPSKLYYSISEVAKFTGVKAHVLRYWETEFPTLRIKKSRTGSRRYRRADIDEILAIKELLYDRGFKIAGARRMRREQKQQAHEAEQQPARQLTIGFDRMDPQQRLEFVGSELRDLLEKIRAMKIEGVAKAEEPALKKKAARG